MPETIRGPRLTDAQRHVLDALSDAIEHMNWEFDPDEYRGPSTCGMAHIAIPDGRASFVRRLHGVADNRATTSVRPAGGNRDGVVIDLVGVDLSVRPGHRNHRLSITNIGEIVGGPEMQRLDVQERLHQLVLERLQYDWDYLADSRVRSRMD